MTRHNAVCFVLVKCRARNFESLQSSANVYEGRLCINSSDIIADIQLSGQAYSTSYGVCLRLVFADDNVFATGDLSVKSEPGIERRKGGKGCALEVNRLAAELARVEQTPAASSAATQPRRRKRVRTRMNNIE